MQLNVLNDLAEAMKALDGKKKQIGAGCVNWTAVAPVVTGSGLLCNQSCVSHVGCPRCKLLSVHQRRLSITATGAMARCALTSFQSMPPNTETKDPQKPKTQQRRRGGEGQAIQRVARAARYDRPVMGFPYWPAFVFFNNKLAN